MSHAIFINFHCGRSEATTTMWMGEKKSSPCPVVLALAAENSLVAAHTNIKIGIYLENMYLPMPIELYPCLLSIFLVKSKKPSILSVSLVTF